MHRVTLLLLVVAIGLGLISLHLVGELRTERSNTQALQARIGELEKISLQQRTGATFVAVPAPANASPFTVVRQAAEPAAVVPLAAAKPRVAESSSAAVPTAPDADRMRQRMAQDMEHQRAMLRDPEYREALRMQQKMGLARSNPDLATDLDLSADQVERLFDLLAEQQLRAMEDARPPLNRPFDPAKVQEMQRAFQERQRTNDAELLGLLGAAKTREWNEYQQTQGVRWQAKELRSLLASKGVPLEESLAKPMQQAMIEQQQQGWREVMRTQTPGSRIVATAGLRAMSAAPAASMEQALQHMAQIHQGTREALSHILTAEQLKVLEEQHNVELQIQRAQLRLMRAQQAAGGADPAQYSGVAVENAGVLQDAVVVD